MTQAITQAAIELASMTIMAVREAEGPAISRRPMHAVPRASEPAMRQPTFDWKAQKKYYELNSFNTEKSKKCQ